MVVLKMDIDSLFLDCENDVREQFLKVDAIKRKNSCKVLEAFIKEGVSDSCFNQTTGYGYDDLGREVIEKIFCDIFKSEDALVRSQFISGTHALTVTLFGLLRPNDLLLSITGRPYDTLHEVIGIVDNPSSLKSFNVKYDEIDLVDNDFDYEEIEKYLKERFVKVVHIQRSKGYSTRESIAISKVEKVCKLIKKISPDSIIMVDNCYCEFVSEVEPIEVGCDVAVGSLIKNLGAGIAPNGGYVVGRKDLINLVAERLTAPGEGKEVGIYFAPLVVSEALKIAILTSRVMERLGYKVSPRYDEERVDIVQNIIFGNRNDLINYCRGIQSGSAIDSKALVLESDMPGYKDKIVMASGSFIQGSSIELSCDGPVRTPYIAYQQGGLSYEYGRYGVMKAVNYLLDKKDCKN